MCFSLSVFTDDVVYQYLRDEYDLDSVSDWLDESIWRLNPHVVYVECWISDMLAEDDVYLLAGIVQIMRDNFCCNYTFVREADGFMLYFEEVC